ncbi:hypothetical protein CLF_105007 [Clonorchis sinensis]|uniref:Uncharacterized protein n=1 Tax=Clonorchis sinensis TaxID=79923 RepID=G7YP28_CLOSI|nr:hypothetical protein CLF_105007 [Clonorchis sinensis]
MPQAKLPVVRNEAAILLRYEFTSYCKTPEDNSAIKQKDEVYFEKLSPILQLDWSPKFPSVLPVSESYNQWASPVDGVFTEDISDNCLYELFKLNLTEQRCRLSFACRSALLTRNLGGYEATHTVLYLTVIELVDHLIIIS